MPVRPILSTLPRPTSLLHPKLTPHYSRRNLPPPQIPFLLLRHPLLLLLQPNNSPLPPPLHHVLHVINTLHPRVHLFLLRKPQHPMDPLLLVRHPRPLYLVGDHLPSTTRRPHFRLLGLDRHGRVRVCVFWDGRRCG